MASEYLSDTKPQREIAANRTTKRGRSRDWSAASEGSAVLERESERNTVTESESATAMVIAPKKINRKQCKSIAARATTQRKQQ